MGSLLLGDLNDYIRPSVACVVPVPKNTASEGKKPVDINLNDCLACSGCITSAETILVIEQSHQKLYTILDENEAIRTSGVEIPVKTVVISVSPVVTVALAIRHRLTIFTAYKKLLYFLKRVLKVDFVIDLTFASNLSLKAAADEFIERYKKANSDDNNAGGLPVYSSECPGWICFAEKRHGNLLPNISTVRSPQQVMGSLIRSSYFERFLDQSITERHGQAATVENIYYVPIMPCFDKKLEASRSDFSTLGGKRDVDCVITTGELLMMVDERAGCPFDELPELSFEGDAVDGWPFKTWIRSPETNLIELLRFEGSSAGGYLAFVIRKAAKELFNITLATIANGDFTVDPRIEVKNHKNQDYTEYFLYEKPNKMGRPLLKFAGVYGFKNIQTFIQKSKMGKVDYDYVEIMACPGACLYGGGQPKLEDTTKAGIEFHRRTMEDLYRGKLDWKYNLLQQELESVYEWINEDVHNRKSLILYTSYHSIEDNSKKNPIMAVQW